MLLLAALRYNGIDKFDQLLVHLMGLKDGVNHLLLRNLVCAGLDHDYLFSGGSHRQGQIGHLLLVGCGVDNELPVNQAHLGHGAGTVKGNVGNAGSDGGTQHSGELRTAVRINGHNDVVQRYIVAVVLGEERTHGAVNYAGGEDGVLRSLSLSLIKAAGNLSHCVLFFLIFHAQGKEINAFPGLCGCGGRGQNHGVPVMHKCGTVGLSRHSADLHGQPAARQVHTEAFEHTVSPFLGMQI